MSLLADVADALTDLVQPLRDALASQTAFEALLRREGWRPPSADYFAAVAAAFKLGGDVENAVARLAQLAADDFSSDADLTQALDALGKVWSDLRAITRPTATLPAPFDRDDFWSSFPVDLVADLFTTYAERAHPVLFAPLHLLGIFDEQLTPPPSGDAWRVLYTKRQVRWDRLATLFTHPENLAHDVYGWGGTLDHDQLLRRLERVLLALHVLAERRAPMEAAVTDYYAVGQVPGQLRELRVPLISAHGIGELGVRALPVPQTLGGDVVGLLVGPYASGKVAAQVPLGGPFALSLSGGLEADSAGVELTPGQARAVFTPGATTLDASAALGITPGQSWILLGDEDSYNLTLADLTLAIDLAGPVTNPELKLRLQTSSFQLTIDPGQGDGISQRLLGDQPATMKAAGALVWSSQTGLHLDGQADLRATIPVDAGLGPAHISQLILDVTAANSGTKITFGVSGSASLGPIAASVQNVGFALALTPVQPPARGTFGDLGLSLGFKAPDGIGLSLDESVIAGGGFLAHSGDQYSGALELKVCGVAVKAFGLIETVLPGGASGYSAIIDIATEFSPGLQLGYGFTLDGVGGLVGINRTINLGNVQSAIWAHHFDGLLFPKDPVVAAPSLMTALDSYFPAAEGRYVFGPLAKLGWGGGMVEALLGVVLEVPEPVKLLLLGEIDVQVPVKLPQLVLHIDFDGGIDFGQKLAFFDASLHDSKLERYPIGGDLAFRYGWGDDPIFALSIGGFNPHYQPPANFPTLKPISLSITAPAVTLTASGYVALTSNTLQFGAKVELTAGTSALNVHGWISFDALVQRSPFAFEFDLSAGVDLRAGSTTLASVHLDGTASGTAPWHLSADASISFLFFDISVHVDKQWGDAATSLPATDPTPLVLAALADPSAWTSIVPATVSAALTTNASPSDAGNAVLVDPAGGLRIAQRVAPLGQSITRFNGAALATPLTLGIDAPNVFGDTAPTPTTEQFAVAQFEDLTDDQKLSLPSFTLANAGIEIGASGVDLGQSARTRSVPTAIGYETTIIDAATQQRPGAAYTLSAILQSQMNARLVEAPPPPPAITLAPERWIIAGITDMAARNDIVSDGSKRDALQALANYLQSNTAARGQLQVVLDHEVA